MGAVEATASYPVNPTASFHGPDDPAGQPPTVSDRGIEATQPPDLPRIPGYRVFRVVAQGGMGTVFEALHIATNRVVALKIINAGWANDNDFRTRFAREAQTLAALEHENIVPIYDAGSWQGLPFLTMKFITGKTLAHHLSALRRDPRGAARLLVQVARAVQYLHDNGIIHRDLKPLNILITPEGKPLVADFGLVRPIDDDSELSLTLIPMGTRQYMSPEQTRGGRENYTPSCDIWGMGVIIYELLAGRRPFNHDDTVALFHQIRNGATPPIPAEKNAPPGLEAIAQKCLQKNPADRYPTAAELATELERWLAGEVIPPPPPAPAPVEVPQSPARPQGRLRIAMVGGVVAFVLVVLVATISGAFRDPQQEHPLPLPTPPTPPPEPPAVKSIAERLRAGETVVLIGEKGPPRVPTKGVPGCDLLPKITDGWYTLASVGVGAAELCHEPIPLPVTFEAEFALASFPTNKTHVGVYVARKQTPAANVAHQTAVLFVERTYVVQKKDEPDQWKRSHSTTLSWWVDRAPGTREVLDAKTANIEPPVLGQEPRWTRCEIRLTADEVACKCEGAPLAPIRGEEVLRTLERMKPGAEFPDMQFSKPAFGAGIGLVCESGEVMYRNVKLVPVHP